MKILFVGHDINYVRFYYAVESALRFRTQLSTLHLYSRPSAWLYARLILKITVRTPSIGRLFGWWLSARDLNTDLIDLRFYPTSTNAVQKSKFERLYKGYVSLLQKTLSEIEFDLAVLPGEYRLFEQATIAALKSAKRMPQIIYFEAGPPGYVYLDQSGVNANASFAVTGVSQLIAHIETATTYPPIRQATLSSLVHKFLLSIDVVWLWLVKKSNGLLDLEEFWVAMRNRLQMSRVISQEATNESNALLTGPSIVYIGQVRNDINHTHFGVSDAEVEKNIYEILSDDPSIRLIWRDHPLELSDKLFERISSVFPNRVLRMNKMSLQQILTSVEGVVTVNSNGGLEALASGLPVRLLGRSYFSKLQGVCQDNLSFIKLRKEIRQSGPDEAIRRDAERFLRECFLPINYRGGDFRNAYLASELILSLKF